MRLYLVNSIRTNNFTDKEVMGKIQTMWEEAYRSLKQYQNSIYGIYYDYESDYKGDYSLSVAIEDEFGESFIEIPAKKKYEIYKVDTTDEQGILNTWSKIWEEEEAGVLKRAYSYDFEKYFPNGEIEIHIAIK
ncbi:GyrI-like domain-containing protein [Pseudogracilibacillus sp. SO30301A]|uniref:GyrI-like domain-containing protein n=1 Tax=Pseudogracilibacillus sp. SO30301A TaxID=3098291 RepID=UPI00300E3B67